MTKQENIKADEGGQDAQITHKSIAAALARAQSEMGRALKTAENPAFKRDNKALKYADLASVVDACMPSLNKHGIAVIQPTFDDDTGRYVKTILIHGDSGETLECRVPLIVGKNDMQGYGSAVTYARRYGLMGMTGIAPEDDDGNAAAKAAPETTGARPAFDSAATKARLIASIQDQTTKEGLMSLWNAETNALKAITDEHYDQVKAARDAKGLSFSAPKNADLDGDSLPYEGPSQ